MKQQTTIIRVLGWVSEAAPLLSLAAMLALPRVLTQAPADEGTIQARHIQVKNAVDGAPWKIGRWVGEDMPIPAAAVEILHSNTILSRRFSPLEGAPKVEMLIVHCSDARDMEGHFPPICYPANGWIEDPTQPTREHAVKVGDRPLEMQLYHYYSVDGLGSRTSIRIFNCFVLPDGRTTSNYKIVSSLGKRYSTSIQGIGQVQLVMQGDLSLDESTQAVGELLAGVQPILAVLGQGGQ